MFDLEFYKNKLLEKYKEKNDEEMYERYEHSLNVSKMCVELIERLQSNMLNKKRITVNSRHRDYVLYTKANRVAYSKDYLIEAIEIPTKKFFIGLQWHPESLYFDVNSNKIFECFISTL